MLLESGARVSPEEANTTKKALATADLVRDTALTRRLLFLICIAW